jgi:hypothetical protein
MSAEVLGSDLAAGLAAAPDPCSLLFGPARSACESARDLAGGASTAVNLATNPLGTIANGCAEAAAWIIDKLSGAIVTTTTVDFTNPAFIKQYAVVFGASTFLTAVLWLIAVIKRAIRGAMVSRAFGEAVGFLWLAVMASAFTPLALALLVGITDTATEAITAGTGDSTGRFLTNLSDALTKDTESIGGGPVMLIVLSLLALLAAAVVWIELLVRAAMLYVGAILGCAVYAGLVDRALWRHVRRWASIMLAVDLVKPILVIVLGLAAAIMADNNDSLTAVLTGLAILFLSIFASVVIYRFVPNFGDDIAAAAVSRRTAGATGTTAYTSPAGHLRNGMATHGYRGEARSGSAQNPAAIPGSVATAAAGMAAHGAVRVARAGFGGGSKQRTGPVNGTGAQAGTAPAAVNGSARGSSYTSNGQRGGGSRRDSNLNKVGVGAGVAHASPPARAAPPAAPTARAEPPAAPSARPAPPAAPPPETQRVANARPANAADKHDHRGDR